jgi:hypothetical protein
VGAGAAIPFDLRLGSRSNIRVFRMTLKNIALFILLAASLGFLAGCESFDSVRESVGGRFSPAAPVTRTFAGTSRDVYQAARLAMIALGYEFVRGGAAQGRLEGVSPIGSPGEFGSSRQREISIQLQPMEGGTVEVAVELKEAVEERFDKFSNAATETPLRDPAAYDSFFGELERRLPAQAAK